MSAIAVRAPLYTLEEALERVVSRSMEKGESVAAVAAELVDFLDRDALYACAAVGLAAKAHDELAAIRGGREDDGTEVDRRGASDDTRGRRPVILRPRHYAKEYWLGALSRRRYVGADGSRRALFDFSAADCASVALRYEGQARGLAHVAEVLRAAETMLRDSRAATIKDLPAAAQRQIAEGLA